MEDISTPSIETPVSESAPPVESTPPQPAEPNVYAESQRGYSDPSRALAGNLQSQIQQAQQTQKAEAQPQKPDAKLVEAPPGQRFGLSEERKHELAAQLKAQKENQPQPGTATAVAPAKAKAAPVDHVKIVGDYFDREDSDPAEAWGRFYDQSYDHYQRLVDHAIVSNRDHALRLLGYDLGPRADDPQFAHLPKELRQTAANLSPDEQWELSQLSPELEIRQLEREKTVHEAEQREWEQREKTYRETTERVDKEAVGVLEKTTENLFAHHRKSLADFLPFEDKESNEDAHGKMLRMVKDEMLESEAWEKVRLQAVDAALCAHYLQAQGKADDAAIARGHSAELVWLYSREFGRLLKGYRDLFGPVFENHRKWREHQRKQGEEKKVFDSEDRELVPGTRFYRPKRG